MISIRRTARPLGVGLFVAAHLAGCAQQSDSGRTSEAKSAVTDPTTRGAYLVSVLGCNDCHTPWTMTPQGPGPDMTRMLSGHPAALEMPPPPQLDPASPWAWVGSATNTAFAGPWGVSYSSNLTPHESGLGVWNEEMFVSALKSGKHMGTGRPILPPMPWNWYAHLTEEDLHAVFAYLKTIPAIENSPPAAIVAAPPGS